MSYVEQLLAENEDIKYEAHQHPFVFLGRIGFEVVVMAIMIAAIFFITRLESAKWQAIQPYVQMILIAIILLILASAVIDFLRWRNEKFLLTDRRVIHLRGIVNKASLDSSLDKINDVQMRQTFMGRMFNYGDIEVQTANENSDNLFTFIRAPLEFKRAMLNAKEEHDREPAMYMQSVNAYKNFVPPYQRPNDNDIEELLLRLNDLRQKNLITDADFEAKKREILSRI